MLRRKLRDERGSAIIMVILICLVLTITLGGLATSTIVNSNVSQSNTETDKAYLAARSGIEIMKNIGSPKFSVGQMELTAVQKQNIQKILDARYEDVDAAMASTGKDVNVDLGDMGSADIKVIKCYKKVQQTDSLGAPLFDPATGQPIYYDPATNPTECKDDQTVELIVRGKAGNREYVINRKINLKPITDDGTLWFQNNAYTNVGDVGRDRSDPASISGGIEGDTIITGNGYFTFDGAQKNKPLHKLIVAGNLIASGGQDVDIDMIATGGCLEMPGNGSRIHGDVLVGLKKNIGDPELNPYFDMADLNGSTEIEGKLKVDGDIRSLVNVKVGTKPTESTEYIPTPVLICYGDCNMTKSTNEIYGTVVVGGDLHISADAEIYGDIICYGNVTIDKYKLHYCNGSIYAAGTVNYKDEWTNAVSGQIYAGKKVVLGTGCSATYTEDLITGSTSDSSSFKGIAYTYTTDSGKAAAAGTLQSTLDATFNKKDPNTGETVDLVGADKFITEQLESSPTPIVNTPDALLTTSNIISVSSSTVGPIEVNQEYCILQGTADLPTSTDWKGDEIPTYENAYKAWGGEKFIYINASNNDVNILIRNHVSVSDSTGIVVNDGGGAHKVRIWLEDGASLNIGAYGVRAILPVSDTAKNLSLADLVNNKGAAPYYGAPGSTEYIDMAKVPRLYVFVERTKTSTSHADLRLGSAGYIPGYIIAPGIKISMDTGRTTYLEKVNTDPYSWALSSGQAPVIYGMLLCEDMDFSNYQGTSIKYDSRIGDEKNERAQQFAKDVSDVVKIEK